MFNEENNPFVHQEPTPEQEVQMPLQEEAAPTEVPPTPQEPPVQQIPVPPYQGAFVPPYQAQPYQVPPYQANHNPGYQAPTPVKEKESKKKEKKTKIVAVALCCSLIGGIIGTFSGALLVRFLHSRSQETVVPSTPSGSTQVQEGQREDAEIDINKIDTSKIMTPAEVYATNVNSTVGVTTSITTNYWGYQSTSAASGSGFIISEDGYILTNHHVIEGSDTITVSFYDGTSKEAKLIGYDAANDIAVLKVDATDLKPVVLGDSSKMNVGDTVLAIGNPLGELTFSLTSGAVSALNRDVTTSAGVTMELIQTDCAINSGNSGGALFNLYGEVIGITNAKYSSGSNSEVSIDNIGFAIPINNVRSIVESLIKDGFVTKPYIGVSVTDVSEEMQSYGLPQGAAVRSVAQESPAEAAGIKVNDIITHVDGVEVTGSSDLVSTIGKCQVDQKVSLTIYRQGQTMELELTVGKQVQQGIQ